MYRIQLLSLVTLTALVNSMVLYIIYILTVMCQQPMKCRGWYKIPTYLEFRPLPVKGFLFPSCLLACYPLIRIQWCFPIHFSVLREARALDFLTGVHFKWGREKAHGGGPGDLGLGHLLLPHWVKAGRDDASWTFVKSGLVTTSWLTHYLSVEMCRSGD